MLSLLFFTFSGDGDGDTSFLEDGVDDFVLSVVIVLSFAGEDGLGDGEVLLFFELLLEWWLERRWWCLSPESEELDLLLERDLEVDGLSSDDLDLDDE